MNLFSYLPFEQAVALCKLAEAEEKPSRIGGLARSVGVPLLGMGAGTVAGFGLGRAADQLHERVTGKKIPVAHLAKVAPLLGAGMGLAYSMYKAREAEDVNRVLNDADKPHGRRY
jgi:hypothetical protein